MRIIVLWKKARTIHIFIQHCAPDHGIRCRGVCVRSGDGRAEICYSFIHSHKKIKIMMYDEKRKKRTDPPGAAAL